MMMLALLFASLLAPLAWAQEAPTPENDTAETVEPPPLLALPELIEFVDAPYPEEAQAQELEGEVLLELEIDEMGRVTQVEILEGLGGGLSEAAAAAAHAFTFSPAMDETGPVPVIIEFSYGFTLAAPVPEETETPVELPVNLSGVVLEMSTGSPVEDAVVAVDGTEFTTVTGADGTFALRGVPPGKAVLRVSRPSYESREIKVEIVEGELTEAKIWAENTSWSSDEAVGLYRRETEEVTRRSLSVEEVRRIPGTFGDPVRVIQSLPGAARSPFGTGFLVIRGSNPEDSAVYVEGIRIPLIYHLGGYVSVINPDMVEAVDYLPGGYGVQYGRSTGGVVDVSIKEEAPEQHRITWSTDLLDSGGLYEGRLGASGDHHVGIAARRSYIDLVLDPILEKTGGFVARPIWMDYQTRYHYSGFDNLDVTALVFGFRDTLLVSTPDSVAQGSDQDFQGDIGTDYGTHRGLVKLERRMSDTLKLRVVPSLGYDYTYFGVGSDFELEIQQLMLEVRAEAPWTPSEHLTVLPGVDFIGGWGDFEVQLPFNPESLADYDPLGEREDYYLTGKASGWGPDFYLKSLIRPLADPDALLLAPGVRTNLVYLPGELSVFSVDPRFTFRLRVLPRGFLKGGTGLYHQPPLPNESYRSDNQPVVLDMEQSWSSALGWDQEFGKGFAADIEVFHKSMTDLIVSNPNFTSLDDQYYVNAGVGSVYGLEVMARRDPVGRFFGWVSYTLSRSLRNDNPEADANADYSPYSWEPQGGWYLFDVDQTHILTAVGAWQLPRKFEFSGRFQYVTGSPYTPYDGGVYDIDQDLYYPYASGERNSERMPPFTALDLRLSRKFLLKRGWLELYLDALNAYRGVNAEFVQYNYDYTEKKYVRSLPFIPSPGFELELNF